MNESNGESVGQMLNPPHLGELIRESMDESGWDLTETANRLDCNRGALSRLLNGSTGMSANIAMALEDIGWGTAEHWMRMQASYELAQARRKRTNGEGLANQGLLTPGQSIGGVDGCKAGWVMVRRDENGHFEAPVIVTTLDDIKVTDLVVIDVPIGLPDSGRRECDLAARKILGPRRNSVFLDARRPLLSMESYELANTWAKHDGNGISRQMWGIIPKIQAVDDWITPARNRTFREGHPELSFRAAAGRPMTYHKQNPEGKAERLEALSSFIDPEIVRKWLKEARGPEAGEDDILDALALCRSAARVVLRCHDTLPAKPSKDDRGLKMEMVF
jgi:addiction module HigA family antidote